MKKSKPYLFQEEDSSTVNEPDVYYSQGSERVSDRRKEPDWDSFPGQFTDEEKIERLRIAIEDTSGYSQDEMREMVASWRR